MLIIKTRVQDVMYSIFLDQRQLHGQDLRAIVDSLAKREGIDFFTPTPGVQIYVNLNAAAWEHPEAHPDTVAVIALMHDRTGAPTAIAKSFSGLFRELDSAGGLNDVRVCYFPGAPDTKDLSQILPTATRISAARHWTKRSIFITSTCLAAAGTIGAAVAAKFRTRRNVGRIDQ